MSTTVVSAPDVDLAAIERRIDALKLRLESIHESTGLLWVGALLDGHLRLLEVIDHRSGVKFGRLHALQVLASIEETVDRAETTIGRIDAGS